jgi:hypothetical protein
MERTHLFVHFVAEHHVLELEGRICRSPIVFNSPTGKTEKKHNTRHYQKEKKSPIPRRRIIP